MRDFSVLSDVEFEELVADLLAAELGQPVERFAVGRDGGIDLRWRAPDGEGKSIGQCKHYQRSTIAQLLAAARGELPHLDQITPHGYRFITSYDLTVGQKEKLYEVFSRWMRDVDDVLGGRDIDGLLTRHPAVERRHPKLWLATGSQLFWTTHSELANRASALRDRIAESLPRYVVNRGYRDAQSVLDAHRVCVIAGVWGIGKTMLAQVLVADAMSKRYEPVEVSGDIDEAWTALDPKDPQVFLYDDFLGQLAFTERLGKNEDARLASFIAKVSSLTSKMLIMTTREYILHDAQRVYERLGALDERMHFVLALEDYTRGDRARILYNHLWHSDISREALAEASAGYRRIVDHANYNPRLIEFCTGAAFDTQSPGYVERFVDVLDHPAQLWKNAFETHLTIGQQLLAVALATLPTPTRVPDLQNAHAALCKQLPVPMTAATFRSALSMMEGTFITIGNVESEPTVWFHNPSLREFTVDWLADDPDLLAGVLDSAAFFEQLRQIYAYATGVWERRSGEARPSLQAVLEAQADRFKEAMARTIESPCPVRRHEWDRDHGQVYRSRSSWFEDRLTFLLGLTPPWIPSNLWFTSMLRTLDQRWNNGVGWKSEAVDLMRLLTESGTAGDSPRTVPADLIARIGQTLDEWLATALEDTATDWVPYLERLRRDHNVVLARETVLAARFESFAEEELERWSPSPPGSEELRYYAREFGLDGLAETIEERIDEQMESDREASSKVASYPRSTPSTTDDRESDEALDQLFDRLVQRTELRMKLGSSIPALTAPSPEGIPALYHPVPPSPGTPPVFAASARRHTRALRRIQRRRAFKLIAAEQHHPDVLAQLVPGGVARLTLGHENSDDAVMPECQHALPVPEYLAETEPELRFFVAAGDALHFRDEDGLVLLPCQVKVRF